MRVVLDVTDAFIQDTMEDVQKPGSQADDHTGVIHADVLESFVQWFQKNGD